VSFILGKITKKNDNVNSKSILKTFQTMRDEKRQESGNANDYNIVAKKLENKVSEFHPMVYTLDNLEGPINILNASKIDEESDEDEEIELFQQEDNISKEKSKEPKEDNIEEENIDIAALLEAKRKEEEEKEKEKERLREKRKDEMLKKYNIDKNEPQIDYTKLENINIDDEYNKINNRVGIEDNVFLKENKTFNEKIGDICKNIIDKGNNKVNNNATKTDNKKNKDTDITKNNIINEIPSNINPEDYHKKVNKFNKFVSINVKKKADKKVNYESKNDNNKDNDNQPEKVNSMYEKEEDKICSKSEIFPNFSNDDVDDFIVDSDSSILSSNESAIIDIDTSNNDDDISIEIINQSDKDTKNTEKIKNTNEKIQKKKTNAFKSLKINETIPRIVEKIRGIVDKIEIREDEYQNIDKFLKEEEFTTKEIEEDDDVGRVIHKEILYDFYNDMKQIKEAFTNNEDIQKTIDGLFGDNLNNVDFLEVYKSRLINLLCHSDFITNIEYAYLEYLVNEKNKNKKYQTNRSTILDLFEDDSDIDDDLFNKCINTLKCQSLNDDKKKLKENEKKKERLKLLRKKATERKIKSIKNKKKRIYNEYQKGITKRHPQKGKNKKTEEFMEKFFSDISLNKDIQPIEEMTDEFLYQKVKGIQVLNLK